MNERGIAGIVSTILLIAISLVSVMIIFVWVQSFFSALSPPAPSCREVNFEAGVFENGLEIGNKGNVDLQGFIIKSLGKGEISVVKEIVLEQIIGGGYSKIVNLGELGLLSGERLLIIPIVLVENVDAEEELVTCDDEFGVEVIV